VISSATAKDTDVAGKTGVKMSGPYEYVPRTTGRSTRKTRRVWIQHRNQPRSAVPPLEELKLSSEDKLWPINDYWSFHAGGGQFKTLGIYSAALEKRYGEAKSAADFAWKSQAMSYEASAPCSKPMAATNTNPRASFSGCSQRLARPDLASFIVTICVPRADILVRESPRTGACANFAGRPTVVVVNGTQAAHKGLKVIAKVYDLAMNEKFSRDTAWMSTPTASRGRSPFPSRTEFPPHTS